MSEELKNENIEEKEECCCHTHEEEHANEEHEHHHEHHHHDHEEHEHHHHDHDDECCGHEEHEHHHHHHDHDDDDECCCHDHDDDDECCDHDHEHHHHDHGHTYDVAGYKLVETHVHEGATVCSFEKVSVMDAAEAKEAMKESILELENWLDESGALIGHVKGYIKSGGTTTTYSTVGNAQGLNIGEHESAGLSIGFASIVFGPSEEELKDKVVQVFERLK